MDESGMGPPVITGGCRRDVGHVIWSINPEYSIRLDLFVYFFYQEKKYIGVWGEAPKNRSDQIKTCKSKK